MPDTWRNLIIVHSVPDAPNARAIIGHFLGGFAGHFRLASASALVRGRAFEQREHRQECRTRTWTRASVFSRALIRRRRAIFAGAAHDRIRWIDHLVHCTGIGAVGTRGILFVSLTLLGPAELIVERALRVVRKRHGWLARDNSRRLQAHLLSFKISLKGIEEQPIMRHGEPIKDLLLLLCTDTLIFEQKIKER